MTTCLPHGRHGLGRHPLWTAPRLCPAASPRGLLATPPPPPPPPPLLAGRREAVAQERAEDAGAGGEGGEGATLLLKQRC
jgi:hypothetical protein